MTRLSLLTTTLFLAATATAAAAPPVGTAGPLGCSADAKHVDRLLLDKPGVYENFLVDGAGARGNLVKITADGVTLRNCEIRNGAGNGVGVFAQDVVIENCRIHHMLAGTFADQHDAHGVTGRWGNVTIRNCDISYCSGDSIQFDPDRNSTGSVTVERCRLWTGPLPADAAGFKQGERPGENAFDVKTRSDGERCRLTIRNCLMHGWNQPSQIDNMAALNLKENVDATVSECVFYDNEIALRVRGPGSRGGAHVTIVDCMVDDVKYGVRAEDRIEQLKIRGLGFGPGVGERIRFVNGKAGPGYENVGEHDADAIKIQPP